MQIEQFRRDFPATPVTSTQPDSWGKIEVGMTRGMVRTLVGDRLKDDRDFQPAILEQEPPQYQKWRVRLFFDHSYGDTTPSREDDILEAIIFRRTVDRPIRGTDWP